MMNPDVFLGPSISVGFLEGNSPNFAKKSRLGQMNEMEDDVCIMMIGAGFGGRDDTYNGMTYYYIMIYSAISIGIHEKHFFCRQKEVRTLEIHLPPSISKFKKVDLTGLR